MAPRGYRCSIALASRVLLENLPVSAYPAPGTLVVQGEIRDQAQSPLFGKIPPEIRNEIFRLALAEYVREDSIWPRESYWKRPGYEGLKTVDTALLRTCKRVYQETKVLPLQDLEVCFYMGHGRDPECYDVISYADIYTTAHPGVRWFRPEHWARIQHFHIFGQMYALKDQFDQLFREDLDICRPTTLTLTIRYTDWWYWEDNAPIFADGRMTTFFPMWEIQLPATVEKVIVEFENIESKVKELEAVVGEFFRQRDVWIWKRRDERELKVRGEGVEGDGIKTWRWTGPTTFDELGHPGRKFAHHGDGDTMGYVVKVVTWDLVKDR